MEIKAFIKKLLLRFSIVRKLYLKYKVYNFDLDEKIIRSKLQQVGHRIENCITTNKPISNYSLYEFEFLLQQMRKLGVPVDEAVLWAFSVFVAGKWHLNQQYLAGCNSSKIKNMDMEPSALSSFNAVMRNRRSVRQWTEDQVSLDDLENIIDVAKWAPSSCNRQPLKLLLINKKSDKEFLLQYFPNTFWCNAPVLVVFLADAAVYHEDEKHFAYLDGATFIQNFLLVLDAKGYGGCWIGFKKWGLNDQRKTVKTSRDAFYARFAIKKSLEPMSMVALGRPSHFPRPPSRQSTSNLILGQNF